MVILLPVYFDESITKDHVGRLICQLRFFMIRVLDRSEFVLHINRQILSYDNFDKEQIEKFLSNGAQPTARVVKLLKDASIKLPDWVKQPNLNKNRSTRNPEKLRKNQPKEEPVVEAEAPAETTETSAE